MGLGSLFLWCFLFAAVAAAAGSTDLGKAGRHDAAIVERWLLATRLSFPGFDDDARGLATAIVSAGGFRCYASLIQLKIHVEEASMHAKGRGAAGSRKMTAASLRQVDVHEAMRICGGSSAAAVSSAAASLPRRSAHRGPLISLGGTQPPSGQRTMQPLWVFNRRHNGFGNQIFEYVFSRLLAESTRRMWRTSLLDPALGESPWRKSDRPPNSESGWRLFRSIFSSADELADAAGHGIASTNTSSVSACLEPTTRCVISDRPYDQHLVKQPLISQMVAAFFGAECESKCLFLIGYYQEPLFFLPFRSKVMQWLDLAETGLTTFQYPSVGKNDIAVHVRCCQHSGGGCDWLYLPFEYYDAILSRLVARNPDAKTYVIAPCPSSCAMMEIFKRKYGATHVTPGKDRHHHKKDDMVEAMAADFRFLAKAGTLVLGKSTFGFWAGFLSRQATEIHIPVESRRHHYEKIPAVQDDPRFIFHNPGMDLWFGQAQGGESAVRYEERGRWFGPKTLDENGNYVVVPGRSRRYHEPSK
jgi:hypothetical protein